MTKVLFVLFYAFINILSVNICLGAGISLVDQTLTVYINETTKLDKLSFRGLFRKGKKVFFNSVQGNSTKLLEETKRLGKLQRQFGEDEPFFCVVNGPGKRSASVPSSVHRLTPGDIDIIGAIGDSLTAGNGNFAFAIPHIFLEFKGLSWSIGGHETWRQFLTLPNVLKVFNPQLYGYSVGTGHSYQKLSRFNVAEFGAMSRDFPHMSRVLVHRITTDPKVKMHEHWKLINVLVGGNDFCIDLCFHKDPYEVLRLHEKHLTETLRTFRDFLPRTMVNVLSAPDVFAIYRTTPKPKICELATLTECPCIFGRTYHHDIYIFQDVLKKWQKLQEDVVDRPEFNREDFTVNLQKWNTNIDIPTDEDGQTDFTYLSSDCFHLSQKGNALMTINSWNSLLEPYNNKSTKLNPNFDDVQCPTDEHPFIRTRDN